VLAIDLINNLVHWSFLDERLSMSGVDASPLLLLIMCLASPVVGLAFWYFIVRYRSSIAKWLLTAVIGIGAVTSAFKLAQASRATINSFVLAAAFAELLKLAAVGRLHTTGGSTWFRRQEAVPAEDQRQIG
jgi:hypothetical protein